VLRTGVGNADAAELAVDELAAINEELVLDEAAAEDEELELDPILDELEIEDDDEVGLVVDVVDPALLLLDEEEEGDEDERTGMELLSEIAGDRLALDEEAAAWLVRDDRLAELLETTEEIEVLTLLILLVTLLSGDWDTRTCLKQENQSR
jgi:hypothetical protein